MPTHSRTRRLKDGSPDLIRSLSGRKYVARRTQIHCYIDQKALGGGALSGARRTGWGSARKVGAKGGERRREVEAICDMEREFRAIGFKAVREALEYYAEGVRFLSACF